MARIPYATPAQYEELMRGIRLPEDTARTNAFRMLAHAPAIGGSVLRLIFTVLAEADLDFYLHELVILRVTQRCLAHYAWAHAPQRGETKISPARLSSPQPASPALPPACRRLRSGWP